MAGLLACQNTPPTTSETSAAPSSIEPPAPASQTTKTFGEFTQADRACSTLKDCEAIPAMYLDDAGSCCRSCSYEVLSLDAVKQASASCSALGSDGCPMKKCVAPPDFDCVEGICTILTPE